MDPIGLFFEIRIRTTGFIYLDGINLYSYVSNNPIRHTDSRGLFISPATAGYVLLAAMVIYLADWIAYNLRDCEKPESNGPAEDPVEVPRRAPPNGRSPPIR